MGTSSWILASGIMVFLLKSLNATVLDLSNMLSVATNRNPLDFLNYGNWCGLGGSGLHLDNIDRCCKMHDLCYEKAGDSVCYDEKPHVAPYRWKYSNGKIYCNSSSVTTTPSPGKAGHACGLVTCRCDAKFTGCIDVYKDTYNPQLRKVRPPLYNAINRFLSQINKKARIDRIESPFISIKLRRSSEYF